MLILYQDLQGNVWMSTWRNCMWINLYLGPNVLSRKKKSFIPILSAALIESTSGAEFSVDVEPLFTAVSCSVFFPLASLFSLHSASDPSSLPVTSSSLSPCSQLCLYITLVLYSILGFFVSLAFIEKLIGPLDTSMFFPFSDRKNK